jgi:hypothetical protein
MKNYIKDPDHNPKPAIKIETIKEYKAVMDSMVKLLSLVMGDISLDLFTQQEKDEAVEKTQKKEIKKRDPAVIIAEQLKSK